MKKILCLFLCVLLASPLFAQNGQLSNSRYQQADCIENLQGRCGVLLLSKTMDLVVNVPNVLEGLSVDFQGQRPNGYYAYVVSIPRDATNTPHIQVSRRGFVYSTKFTPNVKPDYLVAYRIEEVENLIRLDQTSQTNDCHLNDAEAVLQISTTLDHMEVVCSPLLKAKITKTVSKADAKVKVVTIIIPISSVRDVRDKKAAAEAESERLKDEVDAMEHPEEASSDMWNRIDALDESIDAMDNQLSQMGNVLIKIAGSNDLLINVLDYEPRQLFAYVVVPVVVEKEIFVTECSSYMSQAAKFYDMRKYKEARSAYANALAAKDVVHSMRAAIKESILHCDSCLLYEKLSTAALKKMMELRKDAHATQDEVAQYASAASDFLKVLYNYNPDPFYKKYIDKMDQVIAHMPLIVKFTAVEWKTFEEGNYLPNVEVWAYRGDYASVASSLASERKFNKFTSKSTLCERIGTTDERGVVEIKMDRTDLPQALIFLPVGRKDIELTYLGIQDMFMHAEGTYYQKQFRLKMFTGKD